MKKLISIFAFGLMMAVLSTQAMAHCGECESGDKDHAHAKCDSGSCESDCACPIGKAMAALPKMTYKVGDQETCCSASAAALAKEHESHIHYVVAKKEFDSKDEAMVELAAVTTKFVDDFATPHTLSLIHISEPTRPY